jgi:hypothetical protein
MNGTEDTKSEIAVRAWGDKNDRETPIFSGTKTVSS